MSLYQDKLDEKTSNGEIIYYDDTSFLNYTTFLSLEEIKSLEKPKTALYTNEFINNLPDYRIFGASIKDLIKFSFSNGNCHFCAFILSLCFNNYYIETSNLNNFVHEHNRKEDCVQNYWQDFVHSYIVVKYNGEEYVVDTTFGFIMKHNDYLDLFNAEVIASYSKKEIESSSIYQYFDKNKNNKMKLSLDELNYYLELCHNYYSSNYGFQVYINSFMTYPFEKYDSYSWNNRNSKDYNTINDSNTQDLYKSNVYKLIRNLNEGEILK